MDKTVKNLAKIISERDGIHLEHAMKYALDCEFLNYYSDCHDEKGMEERNTIFSDKDWEYILLLKKGDIFIILVANCGLSEYKEKLKDLTDDDYISEDELNKW